MSTQLYELVGTWEEIQSHSAELAGRQVRVIVLDSGDEPYPGVPPEERPSTAGSILAYAGTWSGDDLKERLEDVYANRTTSKL